MESKTLSTATEPRKEYDFSGVLSARAATESARGERLIITPIRSRSERKRRIAKVQERTLAAHERTLRKVAVPDTARRRRTQRQTPCLVTEVVLLRLLGHEMDDW